MARRVFFSFHYENDVWRASQVRNSWVTKPDRESAGFWDSASWESVRRQGEDAVKRWINSQIQNTSVTVVLIGRETASRPYVRYEIEKSCERGNGLLGIFIHNIKDALQLTSPAGPNPFDSLWIQQGLQRTYLSQIYRTYDWVYDQGYQNIGSWIEAAAKQANR